MNVKALAVLVALLAATIILLGYGEALRYPAEQSLDITAVPWGLLVPGYVFFALMATGSSIVNSIYTIYGYRGPGSVCERNIKYAVFFSLITIVPAWTLILSDLVQPSHGFWLVRGFHVTSRIAWMMVLYIAFALTLLAELVYMVRSEVSERLRAWKGLELAIAIAVLVATIAVHSNLGEVFGTISAVPAWYGSYLAAFFIASAVLIGAAGQSLFISAVRLLGRRLEGFAENHSRLIGKIYLTAIPAYWFFVFWQILSAWYNENLWGYYRELLWGSHAPLFWGVEFTLGLVVPLAASIVAVEKRSLAAVLVADIALLIAGFAAKYDLIILGQLARLHHGGYISLIGAGFLAAHSTPYYHPTTAEILLLAGAFIEWPMLLLAGTLLLPLEPGEKPRRLYIFK